MGSLIKGMMIASFVLSTRRECKKCSGPLNIQNFRISGGLCKLAHGGDCRAPMEFDTSLTQSE